MYTCVCVHVRVRVRVRVRVHVRVRVRVHVLVLVCVCLFVCLCACVHLSERVCMHVCVLCVSEMDSYKHVCVYIFPLLTVACHYRGTSANVFCSSKKRLFK